MVHLYIIWLIWQLTNQLGKEESPLALDTNVWNTQRRQLQKKKKKDNPKPQSKPEIFCVMWLL